MKILITGATGFVGSNLIKILLTEKHSLYCTLLEQENNPYVKEGVQSIVFSTLHMEEKISFLKDNHIDGIIHLASFVQSGQHKYSEVESLVDSNILFGVLLLEAASQANVKWFINTGSYWQNYNDQLYSPVNLYAATKEAFQDIAKFYIETNRIKFVTIKLFDTYGASDNRPKIFNLWHKIAATGETLDMSPGEQMIDISYIDDIVDAFVLLANQLQADANFIGNGGIFAVKAEKRYSLKELATIFELVTKTKLNINWGGREYRDREVMIPWTEGRIVPGWSPKVSIEDGIKMILKSK